MAGPRKPAEEVPPLAEEAPPPPVVVIAPFAYAVAKDGEVVQLRKGDVVTDRFTRDSIDHLRSVGLIG